MAATTTTRHIFHPEWIEYERKYGPLDFGEGLEDRRRNFIAIMVDRAKLLPPLKSVVSTEDRKLDDHLNVRIYTPPATATSKALPLLVYFHGGGFMAGNLDTEDYLCRYVCAEAECIIVSVEYPKCPETSMADMNKACVQAYRWAYNHADEFNADRKRFLVAGASAGGSLALHVARRLVLDGERDHIAGLVGIQIMALHPDWCPPQYASLNRSYDEFPDNVPFITGNDCKMAFDFLVGAPPFEDPSLFPLAEGAEGLRNFPPTYLINAEFEPFRDDGAVMEAMLKDNGIPVKRDLQDGLPHYFQFMPLPESGRIFYESLIAGIKWVLDN